MKEYRIRIGKLYVNDISVDCDSVYTNFIYGMDLRTTYCEKYSLEKGTQLIKLLSEIGIIAEIEEIEKEPIN